MAASKKIDIICAVIIALTLLVTLLFMFGERLGITPLTDVESSGGMFTANDRLGDWDASSATRITLSGDGGTVSGTGAYISSGEVCIVCAGRYVISGDFNGCINVSADGNDKVWLMLDGAALSNAHGPAISVQQAGKVFLTLADGSENSISGGGDETADGAIYSRDDLTINGSGSLKVDAVYKHGIVCNDDLVICGAVLDITAAADGIHANDSARFSDALITIDALDDGVTVSNDEGTGYIYYESGKLDIIRCYEGLEAVDITIAGGELNISPTDDGINANGRDISAINISGGSISIINPTGRDADGLDSNGSIYISGGSVFISVSASGGSCAIDFGSESGGECVISGGTLIACGSGSMVQTMSGKSSQCSVLYGLGSTAGAGCSVSLLDENGNVLIEGEIPCEFSSVIISTPGMALGGTYTVTAGSLSETFTADTVSIGCGVVSAGIFGGMHGQSGAFPGEKPDAGQRPDKSRGFSGEDGEQQPGQAPEGFGPGRSDDFDPSQFGDFDPSRFEGSFGGRDG